MRTTLSKVYAVHILNTLIFLNESSFAECTEVLLITFLGAVVNANEGDLIDVLPALAFCETTL